MKTEELIEGYLVYTDNGIEKVHWCNVSGVKELVSPKGKVYGYVPDYFEVKRLQEQIKEANEMLKGAKHLTVKDSNGAIMFELVSPEINDYLKKWGVK